MQTTLLSTKLFIPYSGESLVARPRLIEMLTNALPKGFTLVSAPAGYGKTTLVSSWLRQTGLRSAWLSLEESDNDPIRFLLYLLAALQDIIPGAHADLPDLVEGLQPASFQAVMNILINEIAKYKGLFVLVLDDFHLIQDQSIHDIVAFLIEHIPTPHMHLVLITRTDPPLPLSRMRVRNQMTEIRADQLRFTPGEADALVNGVMGFALSAEEITAMHTRTEGWIAGLQLAGLSMQGCRDIPGFISAFSGSHHYVVDYLADEVLQHLDEPTRSFLLKTSILSRMCASLCEELVGTGDGTPVLDGQGMLENLEKMNLFIIPLDGDRRWYRYHQLFADALNRRLECQHPELICELYQRASAWHEKNSLIGDAIQYALAGGDQEHAAQLVEQNGCYLLMSGELLTLLIWMEAVEEYFPTRPWLVIQKGWALTLAGRMEPAEQAFRLAENLVSALTANPDRQTMVGTISAGRAYWADIEGNIPEAARLAQQALDLLPDTDPMSLSMRSVAMGALAKTKLLSGELAQAREIYDQAAEIGRAANNLEMVINTNECIAAILIELGQLGQAQRLLLDTLPLTLRPDGQKLPLSAQIYSGLSKVYYEWNKLDQAAYYVGLCLEVSQQWGNIEQQAIGSVMSAKVEQAQGNLEKAQVLMRTAEQLSRDNRLYPRNATWVDAALSRYWMSSGRQERIAQSIQASGINPADEISFRHEPRYITLVRWLLAGGDYEAALGLAQRMLERAKVDCRNLRVVELLVLESLAYQGMKDLMRAAACLSSAVSLAQAEGYRRVFLDEGERMVKLLYLVRSSPQAGGYAGELIEAFGSATTPPTSQVQLLIEPLTEREIEVIQLIENGLSNQEIAVKLFISITTVKRHISNIYAKLDVKNRTQAVARGKELGFFSG